MGGESDESAEPPPRKIDELSATSQSRVATLDMASNSGVLGSTREPDSTPVQQAEQAEQAEQAVGDAPHLDLAQKREAARLDAASPNAPSTEDRLGPLYQVDVPADVSAVDELTTDRGDKLLWCPLTSAGRGHAYQAYVETATREGLILTDKDHSFAGDLEMAMISWHAHAGDAAAAIATLRNETERARAARWSAEEVARLHTGVKQFGTDLRALHRSLSAGGGRSMADVSGAPCGGPCGSLTLPCPRHLCPLDLSPLGTSPLAPPGRGGGLRAPLRHAGAQRGLRGIRSAQAQRP